MSPKKIYSAIVERHPDLKKLPTKQQRLMRVVIEEAIALSSHDTLSPEETEKAFKDLVSDAGKPSAALRAYRKRQSLTQYELAKKSHIPQPHVSDMEAGKRSIGLIAAKKLALALGIDYKKLI